MPFVLLLLFKFYKINYLIYDTHFFFKCISRHTTNGIQCA